MSFQRTVKHFFMTGKMKPMQQKTALYRVNVQLDMNVTAIKLWQFSATLLNYMNAKTFSKNRR